MIIIKKLDDIKSKNDNITNKFDLNYDFNILNNNYNTYKDTKSIEKSLTLNGKHSTSLEFNVIEIGPSIKPEPKPPEYKYIHTPKKPSPQAPNNYPEWFIPL
eukprot:353407_1